MSFLCLKLVENVFFNILTFHFSLWVLSILSNNFLPSTNGFVDQYGLFSDLLLFVAFLRLLLLLPLLLLLTLFLQVLVLLLFMLSFGLLWLCFSLQRLNEKNDIIKTLTAVKINSFFSSFCRSLSKFQQMNNILRSSFYFTFSCCCCTAFSCGGSC